MADKNVFDRYLLALRKSSIDEKTEHSQRGTLETPLNQFAVEGRRRCVDAHHASRRGR
jgi:hypothetical protein